VLQAVIPLRRADMRLRLQVAPAAEQDLELLLRRQHATIESQEAAPSQAGSRPCQQCETTLVCLGKPHLPRHHQPATGTKHKLIARSLGRRR
jgi:hypothetical protein